MLSFFDDFFILQLLYDFIDHLKRYKKIPPYQVRRQHTYIKIRGGITSIIDTFASSYTRKLIIILKKLVIVVQNVETLVAQLHPA